MKPENAIEVHNITKSFKVYYDRSWSLKERVLFAKRNRYEERHVINGISFEVKKGEAIGLIGHNGCGKSTTLKLLTKIIYPDSGSIEMRGRVSSLIELGAGFHPDMSGRENIYINASIFGLTKKEIDSRLDDIIEFSELEDFIDNPVRTYSSGMYMRLAFSVAINVDADILLIDEILAVGDVAFQAKCFNKMREIKAQGTTIVIVSHALSQVEQICDRSIWIHDGVVREDGLPREVDPDYMAYMSEKAEERARAKAEKGKAGDDKKANKEKAEDRPEEKAEEKAGEKAEETPKDDKRWGSREAYMTQVVSLDASGAPRTSFSNREPITVRIHYHAEKKLDDVVIGVAIYRKDQTYIYGTNTLIDSSQPTTLEQDGYIDLAIDEMPLTAGDYSIDLALHRPDGFNYDFWREVVQISLKDNLNEVGIVSIKHDWHIH